MHSCMIKKKDGAVVLGTFWALNKTTWTFEVIDDALGKLVEIPVTDCESAVLHGSRKAADLVGDDEDLLERARSWGWKGERS
jgi:hypothetical protein